MQQDINSTLSTTLLEYDLSSCPMLNHLKSTQNSSTVLYMAVYTAKNVRSNTAGFSIRVGHPRFFGKKK